MAEHSTIPTAVASVERRAAAMEDALQARGLHPAEFIAAQKELIEQHWDPKNGANVVARAWTDPDFRQRLLSNGRLAVMELGIPMPAHHQHLVALENTPQVHNVICCTLCSCTAITVIGLPPDWYKDLEYRARIVRQARTVLKDMGLDLPLSTEIRVWDTTTDTRYIVVPQRPQRTEGWTLERLAEIVTRDSMIGVAVL
jgi:nitrile hydratase